MAIFHIAVRDGFGEKSASDWPAFSSLNTLFPPFSQFKRGQLFIYIIQSIPKMLATTVNPQVKKNNAFGLCKRKDAGVYLHTERGSEI